MGENKRKKCDRLNALLEQLEILSNSNELLDQSQATIDLTRPIAPYLPPEITCSILNYVHVQHDWLKEENGLFDFSVLSRISRSWRPPQTLLLKVISIQSAKQLYSTYDLMKEGLGSPGKLTKKLKINIQDDYELPGLAHFVCLLLMLTRNLEYLEFVNPSFDHFSLKDVTWISESSSPLLPKLSTLKLYTSRKDWHRNVYGPLLLCCPKLKNLTLNAKESYEGGRWLRGGISKLVRLSLNRTDALKGEILNLRRLKWLKSLSIQAFRLDRQLRHNDIKLCDIRACFRIISSGLQILIIEELWFPIQLYRNLKKLRHLTVSRNNINEIDWSTFSKKLESFTATYSTAQTDLDLLNSMKYLRTSNTPYKILRLKPSNNCDMYRSKLRNRCFELKIELEEFV